MGSESNCLLKDNRSATHPNPKGHMFSEQIKEQQEWNKKKFQRTRDELFDKKTKKKTTEVVLALQLQWLTRKSFPRSMTSMPNETPALISPFVASSTPHLPVSYFSVSTIFLSFIYFPSMLRVMISIRRKSYVLFSFLR